MMKLPEAREVMLPEIEYRSGMRSQEWCLFCCLRRQEGFFYRVRNKEVLGIQSIFLSIAAFVWPVPRLSFPAPDS